MAHADTVHLYAAGSLKAALTDVAKAYEAKSGNKVEGKFGPSGLLKNEIAGGAKADVFASANMAHPNALHDAGKSGAVILFARNKLCALVKPGMKVDGDNLLAQMLDPNVKLGTSTPKADPSGDYAFESFHKAEAVKPGAQKALEGKALKLTGAKDSAAPPAGKVVYGWHVARRPRRYFSDLLHQCAGGAEAEPRPADRGAAGRAGGRRRLRTDGDERRGRSGQGIGGVHHVAGRAEDFGRLRVCGGEVVSPCAVA